MGTYAVCEDCSIKAIEDTGEQRLSGALENSFLRRIHPEHMVKDVSWNQHHDSRLPPTAHLLSLYRLAPGMPRLVSDPGSGLSKSSWRESMTSFVSDIVEFQVRRSHRRPHAVTQ